MRGQYHYHPNDCYYPTGFPNSDKPGDVTVAKNLKIVLGACPKMGIYMSRYDFMVYFGPNSDFSDFYWAYKKLMMHINKDR